MRDVNGSSFILLAGPEDWTVSQGMAWSGCAWSLAGQQTWRLPPAMTAAGAAAALANSQPFVVDEFGGVARIKADGSGVESLDGGAWVPVTDLDETPLAPKTGRFVDMALGGGRLALLASDGTTSFLQLFDLRGRWTLDTPANPSIPLTLDPTGTGMATGADGTIYVLIQGGVALFQGGPRNEFIAIDDIRFLPEAPNPDPLRQTRLIGNRPGGAAVGMAVDADRLAILSNQPSGPQTLALLDLSTGLWTTAPVTAVDGTPLPLMTGVALLPDALIALMAPAAAADKGSPLDCAVVTLAPTRGVVLAPNRYPMLNQDAPRFASVPGPDVWYSGTDGPRPLLPLPYPAYLTLGALGAFSLLADDPDQIWHRLYAEAYLPPGTALSVWARAAEMPLAASDQSVLTTALQHAPTTVTRVDADAARAIAQANPGVVPTIPATLMASLTLAPFHRQPALAASDLASELPFHPGLSAQAGMPGQLYEALLQRTGGANRRLVGKRLDVVAIGTGDGRHSPCLRALRVYGPRFCYQDQYLPALFHQTEFADETDQAPQATPADFRERLLANLEGLLTPIENRVAAAEYLVDPYAAPPATLPWLASYLGRTVDPGWPEARQRRAIAAAGQLLRQRGTYPGVCLAVDIVTDGAVGRGEVVLLETHRLRRTNATILGIALSGRNTLTQFGVPSGNSIIGDTLVLSAERAVEVLALLAPDAATGADAQAVADFLDEYADNVQVVAIVQGPSAAMLAPAVSSVLRTELPAQLRYEVVINPHRFILGLSPLLDVDTFLDPADPPTPLTLNTSTLGRDALVRDPPALRQ
ncbi:phage tail protein [Rhodopila sp.]|jgi:phage tail-like protein|uniref:phage tail protein n=1 Tax=Rhodopila sp. TaxID=2480087 RepID=UPI002BF41694|nr:phage tail protein [Rhodopila sp.]HVZ08880.1 phage tail protein [Rhodopila sp.]